MTVLHAQNAAVTITVDAGANRRAINPAIYGVAYATTAQLQDLNAPLHRYGGNNTSRYNWELNADNRGADGTSRASRNRARRQDSAATTSSSTVGRAVPCQW